jgi:UDP-glucose 4-epimerase
MILVTGGAGYIGSHAVIALIESGFDVVIFDNLESGGIQTIRTLEQMKTKGKVIEFIQGDLRNLSDIGLVFSKHPIEIAMHFAAYVSVEESVKNPIKYYDNNLTGSLNLFSVMLANKVDKIIFSSTAAVYGNPSYAPVDEKHPTNPINPYGRSKAMAEQVLKDAGFKYACLRYFNVAGADSLLRIGERRACATHLVSNLITSAYNENVTFKLYGDNYNTRDGTCIRDYINVEDLAEAHIFALKYLLDGNKSDTFNLGTAEGSSVKEVLSVCEQITGKKIKTQICGPRDGDPETLIADSRKAEEILGWVPKRSLRDSVKTAYEWHRKKEENAA